VTGARAKASLLRAALLLGLLGAAPALAGDRDLLQVLGYSEDGRYFAFESFGLDGASGQAHAAITIIDLATGRPAESPAVVEADEEALEPLVMIRRRAQVLAARALSLRGITQPADAIALYADGTLPEGGRSLRFGLPGSGQFTDRLGDYRVVLSTVAVARAEGCRGSEGSGPRGLLLRLEGDSGERRELHRDGILAAERGCPIDYRLHGVFVPFGDGTLERGVVLVSAYEDGWEGTDRHFLAIPIGAGP